MSGDATRLRDRGDAAEEGRGLRFAMLTTFYPPYSFGGDALYVRRLARALAGRGHTVDVIHDVDAYRVGGGEGDEGPAEEPPGVRVHPLRSRFSFWSALATHQLGRPVVHGREIRRILDRGFDVVHFHNVSLLGGPGLLEYGSGIKLYTAHEHWLVCPTHILWRHGREPCPERECVRCQLRAGRPPQLWRHGSLLEEKAREVDVFFALSAFSAAKHHEFGFEQPMKVLPSFLPDRDPEPDPEVRGDPDSGRPYFLFVGRLEAIKGLQDVIPHFGPDLPAELRVVGSGAQEGELRDLASGRPSVRFLGQLPPEQLTELYRGAIALLVPSRCFEVFPLVVLEAFREGTPIVARDLGPFPDIVEQSRGGLLFDDDEGLRRALGRLVREPELRSRLGVSARRAFEENWTEEVAMSEYLSVIEDIARERRLPGVLERMEHADSSSAPG